MADGERVHVEVVAVVVTDRDQQVLLTFNDNWGAFSLPMTRRRRGRQGNELLRRAALRVAAEALGVPARLVAPGPKRVAGTIESGRQLVDKFYTYDVFHAEPHPDFADRIQVRQPHFWASPHRVLSGTLEPISESARFILRGVLAALEIPARVQHTSVLIVQRDHPERGRQFLVRRDPDWGYALPSKRWGPPGPGTPADQGAAALAAAERVAREELGLEPGTDVILTPARYPQLTTHGITSRTKGDPAFGEATDYFHSLFDARLRHPETLRSAAPLAWVTIEEVHAFWTAASHGEPGAPEGTTDTVSRTTYEVLLHAGLIPEISSEGEEEAARDWLDQHSQRQRDGEGSES